MILVPHCSLLNIRIHSRSSEEIRTSKQWENLIFAYAKTKVHIGYAVTAQLISAIVFATRIVQSLFFLNPKFKVSSLFLCLYRSVCVRPGRKPRRPVFSRRGSFISDRTVKTAVNKKERHNLTTEQKSVALLGKVHLKIITITISQKWDPSENIFCFCSKGILFETMPELKCLMQMVNNDQALDQYNTCTAFSY